MHTSGCKLPLSVFVLLFLLCNLDISVSTSRHILSALHKASLDHGFRTRVAKLGITLSFWAPLHMATFWALPISLGFSERNVSEIVCVSFLRSKRIVSILDGNVSS